MTGTIKVSPDKLIATATDFGTQSKTIVSITTEMLNKVSAMSSSWTGEASTAYIRKFRSLEKDIQVLNRMIQEHVRDLNQMARAYAATEKSNEQDASALLSGVIS